MGPHSKAAVLCIGASIAVSLLVIKLQHAEAVARRADEPNVAEVGKSLLAYLELSAENTGPGLSFNPSEILLDDKMASNTPESGVKKLVEGFPRGSDFVYAGYMAEVEADLADLATYCTEHASSKGLVEDVVPLAQPRPDGRNALLRIRLLKDQPGGSAWSNWYRDASRVPVFVERSCLEGVGGYVIFLDGSFKYFPYVRGSVWPLTRHGLGSIRTIANPVVDTKR